MLLKPIHSLARKTVHKLLNRLQTGEITLVDAYTNRKQAQRFGRAFTINHAATPWASDTLSVTLTVNNPAFYSKVLIGGNIGMGESYVAGDWDVDDLTTLIRIAAANSKLLKGIDGKLSGLSKRAATALHLSQHNDKANAKQNILAHYDVGNAMYERFLDPRMMYSSALYPNPTSTLAEAQTHKLKTICDKLQLTEQDHLLEIGTGWGGLAIFAAQHYGCRVTTTTISDAQHAEATRRIQAAGLKDKITLLKTDYRDLSGVYDKLVSIEMIEAVGHEYLHTFFQVCNRLLKDNGLMLLQAITYTDQNYAQYLQHADFIQKHIFPGGCLLSNADLLQRYKNNTDMTVRNLYDFGFDYAHTLYDWRKAFLANRDEFAKLGYGDEFIRLWTYYFCYCEGGFLARSISVVQLVSSKPGCKADFAQSAYL